MTLATRRRIILRRRLALSILGLTMVPPTIIGSLRTLRQFRVDWMRGLVGLRRDILSGAKKARSCCLLDEGLQELKESHLLTARKHSMFFALSALMPRVCHHIEIANCVSNGGRPVSSYLLRSRLLRAIFWGGCSFRLSTCAEINNTQSSHRYFTTVLEVLSWSMQTLIFTQPE